MQTLTQSEANAHEQAAELARIEEERVRQDPDSTDEQIAAAREARKSADLAAVLNDADIQRRVAQIESEKPPVGMLASVVATWMMVMTCSRSKLQ